MLGGCNFGYRQTNNLHHITYIYVNTSLNKSQVWHIDGATNKKSIWFFKITNLQMARVKIWAQSDYLSEARVENF